MKLPIPRFLWRLLRLVLMLALGGLLTAVVGLVFLLNSKPDLEVWHTARLTEEFTVDSGASTFKEYLAMEERLFAQLAREVLDHIEPKDRGAVNRYHRGSRSDPERWPRNWNRSWELSIEDPKAGVVLLHGMSDSPYSLRTEGERLHEAGAWVVGLRVPGHGTAPSGLLRTTWEDMAAAVRLAVEHVAAKVGSRPVYIVGFSHGAALAVHYALESIDDNSRPRVSGLVLLSPAIGISRLAAFASWQERIGRVLGLQKLAWNAVLPEFDPFKYQSFTVNAAVQTWRLTGEIGELMETKNLDGMPPVLAFQSIVDATVSTSAVISALFQRLPDRGHELVIYDVNRTRELEHLLKNDPRPELIALLKSGNPHFTLTGVVNESDTSRRAVVRRRRPQSVEVEETRLGEDWPRHIFSLSHVAIPFGPSDPLYGPGTGEEEPLIQIGELSLRGERGTISISASEMLRQRWNPFHGWQLDRIVAFFGL